MTITVEDGRLYLPAGVETPQTPKQAILAARAVLEEEGRWAQGQWWSNPACNDNYQEYVDNPFCNSWHACMLGALGVVTIGLTKQSFSPGGKTFWRFRLLGQRSSGADLYRQAAAILDGLAQEREYADGAIELNDDEETTRQDVLDFMAEAAERAD